MRTVILAENVKPAHFLSDAMLASLPQNNIFADSVGKDCADEISGSFVFWPIDHRYSLLRHRRAAVSGSSASICRRTSRTISAFKLASLRIALRKIHSFASIGIRTKTATLSCFHIIFCFQTLDNALIYE